MNVTPNLLFRICFALIGTLLFQSGFAQTAAGSAKKPNIILILTDDQGIGDIGYLDNPFIKTPNLDRMAKAGVILSNFYVSPVCAPTRASLMTGKYAIRTGVHDTYNGGSLMATQEHTVAEYLAEHRYKTGIFGKWHLGDNYPFRAMDQGFQTSLLFKGGGVGQPGDVYNYARKDSSYFNPVLFYNDSLYRSTGYCSDVYTDAAISYVKDNQSNPFFLYLSYNAPHTPLQVPKKYYDLYTDLESQIRSSGNPDFLKDNIGLANLEQTKRVYAMMSNIDDNIGRLMQTLEEQKLLDNTIVIFMSDNGPQQNRFKGNYRGLKGTVYEGGIKVPAFVYAPTIFNPATVTESLAHIDLLPTLLDLTGQRINTKDIDGKSFAPLLKGKKDERFNSRPLYFYWQRGFPEPYRNIAVRQGDYKLVGNTAANPDHSELELYHVKTDPGEQKNISKDRPDVVQSLKENFDKWLPKVLASNQLKLPAQRIIIGSANETKSTLNRNDAKGIPVVWDQDNVYCYWDVHVEESGFYNVDVHFLKPLQAKGKLYVRLAPYQRTENNTTDKNTKLSATQLYIEKGDYMVEAWYQDAGGQSIFPFYVDLQNSKYVK